MIRPLAAAICLLLSIAVPLSAFAAPPAMFGAKGDTLVAVVHGDVSMGGPVDYHYGFAAAAAALNPGVVAAALLRPGYYDRQGRRAPGRDFGRKDHYTAEAARRLADDIRDLKQRGDFSHVIVVGHSGGAAVLAIALGVAPGLVDSAILVACPCDVPQWRRHVAGGGRRADAEGWVRSLSPPDFLDAVAPAARIVAVTSSNDRLTPPWLARGYVDRARARGLDARFVEAPANGHLLGAMTLSVMPIVKAELEALRAR